jgi:tetratricopeptide (TPR) repeat protein
MRHVFMVTTTAEKAIHAHALCEKGRWDQVLSYALTWHANDPLDHKALFYAGLGFTGLGNYTQAEVMYRQALEIDPTDTKVWNNLGGILFEYLRRPSDGIRCLEQTLKLNPDNKLGWLNLAAMVVNMRMPEKALEYADRALALDPGLVEAYLCKGVAARALGRTEILQQACESLSKIKPEHFLSARHRQLAA